MECFFKSMCDFRYLGNLVLNLEHLLQLSYLKCQNYLPSLECAITDSARKKIITSELTIKNSWPSSVT